MSIEKQYISKKKVAAGAALVALSGFVPQPMVQQAHAASAQINVTGSLITGVQLAPGNSAKFGVVAPTGANGSVTLAPGAGNLTSLNNAVKIGAASTKGSFSLKVVKTTVGMDLTVAGLGSVTLLATDDGAGPTGTVKLAKVIFDKAAFTNTADLVFNSGGGTTDTLTGKSANSATTTILVGGQLTWGATQPLGQFTQAITLTAAF